MKSPQIAVLLLSLVALPLAAAEKAPLAAAEKAPSAAPAGLRQEIIGHVDEAEKKLIALAEAIPADKFAWRPAPGVRSVSEVLAHVAGGNYFLLSMAGVKEPEGVDRRSFEKVTDKAKVQVLLKDSFAFVREQVAKTSDADLDKQVDFFGSKTTVRSVQLRLISHSHEHLGQMIAYARSIGVTPPWSAGN
jgi:uncharacterized damage-inducible protein DinB